jgi:membrane protein YqaA with SNARE-associated domain
LLSVGHTPTRDYAAAFNQADVSNALTIIGMFMPKFGLTPFLGTATFTAGLGGVTGVLLACWATSPARSHDPFSWERATEKSRNT